MAVDLEEYVDPRKYTKGMCYALCEFLDALTQYNQDAIDDISSAIGYDGENMRALLSRLSHDIDGVIGDEQNERDDTDQMAQIMEIKHIPGEDDEQGVVL